MSEGLGQGRKFEAEVTHGPISVVSLSPLGTASSRKTSEAQKSGSQAQPRAHCCSSSAVCGLPAPESTRVQAGPPEGWESSRKMRAGGYRAGHWQGRCSAPLWAALCLTSTQLVWVPSASSRTSWSLPACLPEWGACFMIRTQSSEIMH